HDGKLSGVELDPAERPPARQLEDPAAGTPFSDWTDARFNDLDHNRDGQLTRDEWHFDLESFRRVDYNRDGRLSREEFMGADVDDDRSDRFADLDVNRDGRVDRNEWHGGARAFDARSE